MNCFYFAQSKIRVNTKNKTKNTIKQKSWNMFDIYKSTSSKKGCGSCKGTK
jgi:hypothetical protein